MQDTAQIPEKKLEESVITLPSFIKDTTDFLRKLENIKDKIPKI